MAHPIVYGPAGSTYVWSARLALAEKGVTHELVDVRFGAQREEPHLERQPFAKVPAFEHDGFALYETQAIMRYVDERASETTNSTPNKPRSFSPRRKSRQLVRLSRLARSTPSTWRRPSPSTATATSTAWLRMIPASRTFS